MRDSFSVPASMPSLRFLRRDQATRERPQRRELPDRRERPVVETRQSRMAADVRRRLEPSCRHWDNDEFDALVERIAEMKTRWIELGRGD